MSMNNNLLKYDKIVLRHKTFYYIKYSCLEYKCASDLFKFIEITTIRNVEYFAVWCAKCEHKTWIPTRSYFPVTNNHISILTIIK